LGVKIELFFFFFLAKCAHFIETAQKQAWASLISQEQWENTKTFDLAAAYNWEVEFTYKADLNRWQKEVESWLRALTAPGYE